MSTFEVCIAFISAILTIAYPILVEVISRLDEKYYSIIITDLFNEQLEKRVFKYSLYTSIVFIILYLLKLPSFAFLPRDLFILNNSALILFSLSSFVVVVSFFLLIEKIFIYYRPLKLTVYLIKKHNTFRIRETNDFNNNYFSALSDLLFYSIKNQNQKIATELSHFMYSVHQNIRSKSSNVAVEYPIFYYDMHYKAIEELALFKNTKLSFLEYRIAGSVWLIGESGNNKISELTYNWMWTNQKLSLKYNRDDFVLNHWENAHQYYDFRLVPIQPDYLEYPNSKNQVQVNERQKERNDFFYFHITLGALLLYLKKYEAVNKIFHYSQSIPPRYVLLPERMDEIFQLYYKVIDDFDNDFNHLSFKYSFPNFEGIQADERIKDEICKYLALLFIRQYSIVTYLVYQEPLKMPNPLNSLGENKRWLERLPFFKTLVINILKNIELLTIVDLRFITEDYCASKKIKTPVQLLEEFEQNLKESINETELTQDISAGKKEKFKNSTAKILVSTFEQYKKFNENIITSNDTESKFIIGEMQILDKSSFADLQGVEHLNFDSFLATSLAHKFQRGISELFYFHQTERYLIRENDLLEALSKLNIKAKNVALVGFWYKLDNYPVKTNLSFENSNRKLLGRCLFILREEDLPAILYNDIKEELKKEYQLERENSTFNIYTSIIDLYKNKHLHKEVSDSGFQGEIEKQVLLNIFINVEVRWKRNIKCVMIQIASAYREDGIISTINDIKEF